MTEGVEDYVPNAMARATSDFVNGDIVCTLSEWNTIIASPNDTPGKFYGVGLAYMYSISIWAIFRGIDCKSMEPYQIATSNM